MRIGIVCTVERAIAHVYGYVGTSVRVASVRGWTVRVASVRGWTLYFAELSACSILLTYLFCVGFCFSRPALLPALELSASFIALVRVEANIIIWCLVGVLVWAPPLRAHDAGSMLIVGASPVHMLIPK